jgi:TonB family protein
MSPVKVLLVAVLVALAPLEPYVPARYLSGPLPPIPIEAVGGGEVFLELTVSASGRVTAVKPLRATPPFTRVLSDAVSQWQFRPAEELIVPVRGEPPPPSLTKPVESKALVAGEFRPPSLNVPTLGTPPRDVASESDAAPFPMSTVMPPYPPLARDTGVVLVEVRVGKTGQVVDATVVRSAPPFDSPALDAARQWTFRPARVHGVSIETFAYIVFGFRQPVT